MNYIILDMEWNQPSPWKKIKYENDICLYNEIIQIGAVKLDSSCEIVDTYSVNIKPQIYKEINKNVNKLTGIDQEQLDNACSIFDAVNEFRTWCGSDYIFITWGYDDASVLSDNMKFFDIDDSWIPQCYNLQMIFCSQLNNENRQYSLEFAANHFEISIDKPLHNALTDAYYTALICKKLDLENGIRTYKAMVFKDKSIPDHMKNVLYKKNYKMISGYDNIIDATNIKKPVCCECGTELKVTDTASNGPFSFLLIGSCPTHGTIAEVIKINKSDKNKFNATKHYFSVDEYNKEYFKLRIKKMRSAEKKRLRQKIKLEKKNKADPVLK